MPERISPTSHLIFIRKDCKPTRFSKSNCYCKRCEFVNNYNRAKVEDARCEKCMKFHIDWFSSPVCEKCLGEKTNA
jgi:hypothetical protein